MRNLDLLPLPARDLIDMERYRSAWKKAHGFFSLNLVASRGCPYRCNWCAKPIYGDSFHGRSPESVALEMRELAGTNLALTISGLPMTCSGSTTGGCKIWRTMWSGTMPQCPSKCSRART